MVYDGCCMSMGGGSHSLYLTTLKPGWSLPAAPWQGTGVRGGSTRGGKQGNVKCAQTRHEWRSRTEVEAEVEGALILLVSAVNYVVGLTKMWTDAVAKLNCAQWRLIKQLCVVELCNTKFEHVPWDFNVQMLHSEYPVRNVGWCLPKETMASNHRNVCY